MIKITDILSKPVVSLFNSSTEGIVKNAIFDKNFKRLKWLVLFDNNEHLEEKALNIKSIYSYGENAIIIKDGQDLNLEISSVKIDEKPFPINNNIYTYLGKFVGKVSDIILDDNYYIKSIVTLDNEIDIKNIISSGQDAMIIQDEMKILNVNKLKRKKTKSNTQILKVEPEQKVSILLKEQSTSNTNEPLTESHNESELLDLDEQPKKTKYILTDSPSTPTTLIINNEILIGRKLDKNIYSQNKELIAKKNTKITNEIINKAKMYYKLRELTKYSH